jgi:hypothetical protein
MSERIDAREARLPQWAQAELNRLRANIKHLERKANGGLGPQNPRSNVWLESEGEPYLSPFLPSPYRTARFYVGEDRDSWVEARVSERDRVLELRCNDSILVLPSSTNVVSVSPVVNYADQPPRHVEMYVEARRRRRAAQEVVA